MPDEGSGLRIEPQTARSDAGGVVSATVTAGKVTGDQYLTIIPEGAPDKAFRVRFIVGSFRNTS